MVGTWDGARLTLTEPPTPPRPTGTSLDLAVYFASPCPEPEGGWRPADSSKTTNEALRAARQVAEASPRFVHHWPDYGHGPESGEGTPSRLVLNVLFTGDLEENERRIRQVWGGALCVSRARYTEAELERFHRSVWTDVPGIVASGVNPMRNRVELTVFVATDDLQRDLDSRYGPGAVRAEGVLRPID